MWAMWAISAMAQTHMNTNICICNTQMTCGRTILHTSSVYNNLTCTVSLVWRQSDVKLLIFYSKSCSSTRNGIPLGKMPAALLDIMVCSQCHSSFWNVHIAAVHSRCYSASTSGIYSSVCLDGAKLNRWQLGFHLEETAARIPTYVRPPAVNMVKNQFFKVFSDAHVQKAIRLLKGLR